MVWEGRSSQVKSSQYGRSAQVSVSLLGQCRDSVLDQFAGSSQDSVLDQCAGSVCWISLLGQETIELYIVYVIYYCLCDYLG